MNIFSSSPTFSWLFWLYHFDFSVLVHSVCTCYVLVHVQGQSVLYYKSPTVFTCSTLCANWWFHVSHFEQLFVSYLKTLTTALMVFAASSKTPITSWVNKYSSATHKTRFLWRLSCWGSVSYPVYPVGGHLCFDLANVIRLAWRSFIHLFIYFLIQ